MHSSLVFPFLIFALLPGRALAQATPASDPNGDPSFRVQVIATTPLPGVDLLLEEIPAPVQTAVAAEIHASGALDMADFLNRRFTSVHVNETQGNPYQADLNYRGYTASPLLGTPQGLSVYMDGVRMNQPFGDVVSWDLIPRMAISSTTLIPGSNPLFGLNTLGGAISVQTKDGRTAPGTSVQAVYGSGVSRSLEVETGGSRRSSGLNWYLAGNLFAEDGWRDVSPTDVRQWFSKLGWHQEKTDLALTFAYADNSLTGNGLQDFRLLDADYRSVYTSPDATTNRASFLNLSLSHTASRTLSMAGNAYYRDIRADTTNGDINEDSLDQSLYQLSAADIKALTAAGYTGFPITGANASNTPFPSWRCIAQALEADEPSEKCNGLLTNTHTRQHNYGASGQATWRTAAGPHHNQFTAGAAVDASRVDFDQLSQFGYLNPDRTVTTVNAFADGTTNQNGEPVDTRVNLHGSPDTWSLYATDTLALGSAWHATASGRYNRTTIDNTDRLNPGGGPGSLDGVYHYGRFNPAVGLTFTPSAPINAYFGFSEGSRAPTSIELGCADPNEPCKLPNSLAGDPPLGQVTTHTWEAGVRGSTRSNQIQMQTDSGLSRKRVAQFDWSAGFFRSTNTDDILFVTSDQTGFGYFKNFGQTRRQGLELSADGRVNTVTIGAGYTFLDATYQSSETLDGSSNSTNDAALTGSKGFEGTVDVAPGDRIPLIPRHMFKSFADIPVTRKGSVDVDLVTVSSAFARGNENNLHQPDGTYYLGSGSSGAYATVNLGARYQLTRAVQLIAQINNVFDTHYETAAQLGPAGFTAAGAFVARPLPAVGGEFPLVGTTFVAPGAPTTFWIGTRVKF